MYARGDPLINQRLTGAVPPIREGTDGEIMVPHPVVEGLMAYLAIAANLSHPNQEARLLPAAR